MDVKTLESELRRLRDEAGRGNFDHIIRKLNRERIGKDRPERVHVSASFKRELYERQDGICACGCGEELLRAIRKNHADHFDPNDTKFNRKGNLRLLLPEHNLEKSSKSPYQVSKESGRTVTEQIEDSNMVDEPRPEL